MARQRDMPGRSPEAASRVRPSARDPVASWLDVFIPMTGLPRPRAEEIRAELDDHIRARVDDLMITGLSEPEAVQRAVEELGETADLARRFRTALKPKRRTLMHAALIAATGAAVFLGVSTFTGSNTSTRPAGDHHAEPAVRSLDAMVDLGATWADAFASLDERTDRPVLVHWDRLEDIGVRPEKKHGLGVDALSAERFFMIFREKTSDIDPVVAMTYPDLIEVSVLSQFDERTIELRSYDIADLAELHSGRSIEEIAGATNNEPVELPSGQLISAADARRDAVRGWDQATDDIMDTVRSLSDRDAWTAYGGDLAHAEVVGGSLLINAPARIHEEVERILDMLREDAERTRQLSREAAERREMEEREQAERAEAERQEYREREEAERRERIERAKAERLEKAERLRAEMDRLLERVVKLETQRNMLSNELNQVRINAGSFVPPEEEEARKRWEAQHAEAEEKVAALKGEVTRIETEIADARAFRDAVRARYIEIRWGDVDQSLPASANRLINPDDFRRPDGTIDYDALRMAARERADHPINPDDFRRSDGTIDYEALREAARERARARQEAERNRPKDTDQAPAPSP